MRRGRVAAPVAGGRAYRLTADGVPVGTPRLSPDGTRVAWTSWREGAAEVFAADADGGSARRLTWWGGARCRGWTPSGEVLALTAAGQPLGRLTWAWDVPVDGGAPRRREHGPLSDLARVWAGVLYAWQVRTLVRETPRRTSPATDHG